MRVALLITCYNDTLFPETGKAVVRVLERLGHTVEFPAGQTCCGQMHWNTGYQAQAMPLLERFVAQFRRAEAVVVPSTSCVSMMRDHYPKMAERSWQSAGLAREVAEILPRVWEFSEFLTKRLGLEDVGAFYPHRVTYHASCHGLRNLGRGGWADASAAGGARAGSGRTGGAGAVLRVWGDVRGEERGGLDSGCWRTRCGRC